MKKFWKFKKFWFLFLVLLIAGLFIYFSWFFRTEIKFKNPEEIPKEKLRVPISSVYRYDFKKGEYFLDEGESWQNSDFTRYIYDSSPEKLKLEKCYYFFYDNLTKKVTAGGQRKCNNNLTITVGENKNCLSQEKNACVLYVYAVDELSNRGEMAIVTYSIDWEKPKVGKIFQQNGTFLAEVSDNLKVDYCWFYLDGENKGSMRIEGGLASFSYAVGEEELHKIFVRCADHFDIEKQTYLNFASGEPVEIGTPPNQPPEISFCKVLPVQGGVNTNFSFEAEASDPDKDTLSFNWDFGDGKTSSEKNPNHYYLSPGTFEPKVTVSDGKGGENNCSTAWVVVNE